MIYVQWLDNDKRYGIVSRTFHWTVAVLILWQFLPIVVWRTFGPSVVSRAISSIPTHHAYLGTLVLLLVLARIVWALINFGRRPPQRGLAGRAASTVHVCLYGLMVAIPSVPLMRTYPSRGLELFGYRLAEPGPELSDWATLIGNLPHGKLAWALFALVVLHVGAACVHWVVMKDDIFSRMASTGRRRSTMPHSFLDRATSKD